MRLLSISLFLVFGTAFQSCNQNDCETGTPDPTCICYEIYAPVCGCDNVTYSNDCHAECAGITEYSEGECN